MASVVAVVGVGLVAEVVDGEAAATFVFSGSTLRLCDRGIYIVVCD